jgi:hypothetical protein
MSYRYYYFSLAERFLYLTSLVLVEAYILNLENFSKIEGIPSWIWLLFFGAWFQLFGLFWMVTGLLIFRPLP